MFVQIISSESSWYFIHLCFYSTCIFGNGERGNTPTFLEACEQYGLNSGTLKLVRTANIKVQNHQWRADVHYPVSGLTKRSSLRVCTAYFYNTHCLKHALLILTKTCRSQCKWLEQALPSVWCAMTFWSIFRYCPISNTSCTNYFCPDTKQQKPRGDRATGEESVFSKIGRKRKLPKFIRGFKNCMIFSLV